MVYSVSATIEIYRSIIERIEVSSDYWFNESLEF